MEFKPSWINVTYHRSKTIIRKNEAGVEEKNGRKKAPRNGIRLFKYIFFDKKGLFSFEAKR